MAKSPKRKPKNPRKPATESRPVTPTPKPAQAASVTSVTDTVTPRFDSVGCRHASAAAQERGISAGALAELCGQSRPLMSMILNGRRSANHRAREVLREQLGTPFEAWDLPPTAAPPSAVAAHKAPSSDAPPPRGATPPACVEEDPDPLALAKAALVDIQEQLSGELAHSDRCKYLGLKTATAKLVAQITGELDQTDLQKFKRTIEYQDLTRRIIRAIQPFPGAADAVIRELGHAVEVTGSAAAASGPLDLASLREHCGYATRFVSTDDLCPAVDALVYPVADRERELVTADRELARRIVVALEKADPVIMSSKVSYTPANDYRHKTVDALKAELAREDLYVAFERDFGALACERARALG